MLRKVLGAVIVVVLCAGISLAEEIRAVITKVADDKVTFAESKGKGEKGPEKTLSVAANVKVVKAKFNKDTKKLEAGDPLEGGLKNELFTNIGEKGRGATIVTEGDKIVEIRVFAPKGK